MERLKLEKETPINGAVLLCGVNFRIKDYENDSPYFFEPPIPVKHFCYKCDSRFHLEEIIPLYEYKEETAQKYAVCVVRGEEAKLFFYIPEVDDFRTVGDVSRTVRNKHGRGGFSANRFQRLRDNEINALVKKICDLCEDYCFTEDHVLKVEGIILVGNGEKKTLVSKHLVEILEISAFVVSTITTDGTLERSQKEARKVICSNFCSKEQRIAEKEISEYVTRNPDRLVFGKKEVAKGLRENTLQKVFMLKNSYGERMRVILDNNNSAEKKCFSVSPTLEMYGNCIGIKWY